MRFHRPPSAEDLLEMAEAAFAAIPEALREAVRGTALLVEELPDDETLQALGLEHPWELTGLYRGTPLTQKSVLDVPAGPDTILLYREPILVEWIETGEDLFRLVRNVLIHEIGHHFGFSDEDIARLEGEG
ncbi:metallopeptidase family protein [Pseudoroseomonas ludipueritiae]|uniref:Metallopeptidase family protein n=1 Tax=Pseudoroseomonas ludipueritiae TaxID=198093 RepID=A0ABR7R961_9PROT|nr:metallopeptidase family protein [Pseudoroseomonas ludipueritiae]MBC9178228.1 metallopeptidase family protein [Pseudoroseomonas ludipueritiae]MCG7364043.1 metallopeptidase family protein [Roseomonas sp. ACRSG]